MRSRLQGRALAAALACGLALALPGCDSGGGGSAGGAGDVVAEVNGEPITRKEVYANFLIQGKPTLPAEGADKVLRTLVEQLVERRLILQKFRESGEYVDDQQVQRFIEGITQHYGPGGLEAALREEGIDREQWLQAVRETLEIEQLLERDVYSKVEVSEEEIQAFYERNPSRFRLGRRWRLRQIVVPTEEEAHRLRAQIVRGAPFTLLAREKSIGPEREKGGDLGYFSAGELPEGIEAVIKYLKEGEVSRVVRTTAGYHILQVTERRSAGVRPLRSAREDIRADLLARKGRERLERWLADLKSKAVIHYFWSNLGHVAAG